MTLESEDVIETVQVALRIRPLIQSELARGCELCVETIPNEPQVQIKGMAFTYNHVFPPEVSQEDFYNNSIKGLVKRLHKGYNVTILAYGQTGSGKTYSMGTAYSDMMCKQYEAGVIPRAINDIFEYIEDSSDKFVYKVKVSFLELYQEQLYDLLSTKSREQSVVDIREENRAIVLPGLTEVAVSSVAETLKCLVRGSDGRATGATAMNLQSSRSHAIFTVHIFKENKENRNQSTTSKFHLVDLAGSERSKKTKATGDRFKEGVKINQGLLALGNVISALGDGSNRGFVGYRDSKLTRLLQDSLGGNSMTLMIACVSPADYNLEETISTLRYADRARQIRNKPIVNQDPKSAEIMRLNDLVQQLRLQIVNNGCGVITQDTSEILKLLEDERRKNLALQEKYQEVLAKNKKLSTELQKSLSEHTNMIERAFLAEASKDKVERKLTELTEECNQTIEHLKELKNESTVNEEAYISICKMRSRIVDIQAEQKQCGQMILKLADDDDDNVKIENDNIDDLADSDSPDKLNASDLDEKEEAHALDQAAKNNQLKDLIRSLSEKMNLAEKLSANNQNLETYSENVKESETKILELEKEKDILLHQLKSAQLKTKLDPKVLDERKAKIQQLENEINTLKKKCQQQASLIKMKEKNDLKITSLSNEIQQMKAAKVKLIRTMRVESERFRSWKLQNEKKIVKLCNQDRKMQSQIVKMENQHTKQQNVLKRRVEEAVATNKRLKEAMERQQNAQKQRGQNFAGKSGAVQQWVEQELELKGSLVAAEFTLEGLMEDRGTLTQELEKLKAENPKDPNVAEIQEDIQLRTAQISDLQQKILAGNQENKAKSKWDTVQSMVEAKSALKYLFDVAAEAKREIQNNKFKNNQENNKYEELRDSFRKTSSRLNDLEEKLIKETTKHKRELTELDKQHEEKITTLIKQLNNDKTGSNLAADRDLMERLEILQDAFERAQTVKTEVQNENMALQQEIEKHKIEHIKNKRRKVPGKTKAYKTLEEINWGDVEDETNDDSFSKDPDWSQTPLFKRIARPRHTVVNNDESEIVLKRTSDGQSKCACKRDCSRRCGCRKLDAKCNSNCKCDSEICLNRDNSNGDHSSNASNGDDDTSENMECNDDKYKVDSQSENENGFIMTKMIRR